MKIRAFFYIILLLAFTACSEDDNGEVTPAALIRSITAATQSDNALRVDIKIDFKKAASYQIEYWKADDDTSVHTTRLYESAATSQCTLILLTAQTEYCFKVIARADNQSTTSSIYKFTTGILPSRISTSSLMEDKMEKKLPGYLLITKNDKPSHLILTNTEGEAVWYHTFESVLRVATFDEKTKTIACIVDVNPKHSFAGNKVLVMDLYGNVLLEKAITDVLPHHEIRRLSNGDLLMVHYSPKKFDLTAQGGGKEETVYGDGLVIMDMEGNIKWDWDCFYEVNPADDPNIMKKIKMLNLRYCDDWLHANSADMDEDGNLYITFNWTSELWKIDKKTKKTIYRLGGKGNISIPQNAYMQGLHCVSALNRNQALVFDNGLNTHHSRGLLFTVNEEAKTAQLSNCIELPSDLSSPFQGSVQRINENLYLLGPTMSNIIIFTDAKGSFLRTIKMMNQSYRVQYIRQIED